MFSLPPAVCTYQSIPWRQTEYNLENPNDHILGYFYQEKLLPHVLSSSINLDIYCT